MSKDKNNKTMRTTMIGGQAVLEGVMMRGASSMALAVRGPKGNILLETERVNSKKSFWKRCPVIRGMISFVQTMIMGINMITKSAEMAGEEEEKVGGVGMTIAVFAGLLIAVGLFFAAPMGLSWLLFDVILKVGEANIFTLYRGLVEGGLRLIIFIVYLCAVALMKDIKRTYMYHGAEHRTINCYERELDMTVANVQSCSTRHDRCGTSFLFYVMIISLIVFVIVNWILSEMGVPEGLIRMPIKIAFIPLVAGISYEVLRGLARTKDNFFTRILKAPGLALQKLTTKEPDDGMAEIALHAFKAVYHMDKDLSIPAVKAGCRATALVLRDVEEILARSGITDKAETEWLIAGVVGKGRTEIYSMTAVLQEDYDLIIERAHKRAAGMPLDRIEGYREFFGRRFKLGEAVLSPRPETELVCEKAIALVKKHGYSTVLDLCTGSGALGVTIAAETGAETLCADISSDAVKIAKENAGGAENVRFLVSDLFESVEGTFDLVVSNPPYIPTAEIGALQSEVREYDPKLALDGGVDGLDFYRRIADRAADFLNAGGALVLETGAGQSGDVKELLTKNFTEIEIFEDYGGKDRIITAVKRG